MSELPTIAVFGATSYLGANIVKRFLENGWKVRAHLRSGMVEHVEYLHQLRRSGHRLSLFEADCLDDSETTKKALDTALTDCTAAVHCVFRSFYGEVPPERREKELVEDAVKATRAIVAACLRVPSVRRVVMASTLDAALGTPRDDQTLPHGHPDFAFTETDWADDARLRECGSPWAMRTAGMLLSEKAMYEMCEGSAPAEGSSEGGVAACSLLLGHCVGPLLSDALKTDSFLRDELLPLMNGCTDKVPRGYVHLVHVADATKAVLLLTQHAGAKGRYLCAAKTVEWADLCATLRDLLPGEISFRVPHIAAEGEDLHPIKYSCARLASLGFQFDFFAAKMLSDFVESAVAEGMLRLPEEEMPKARKAGAAEAEVVASVGPTEIPKF